MSEIPSLRTRNSKTYDLGRGEYRLDCGGDISHFQNTDGSWEDVDLSVSDTVPEGWTRYYSKNEWRVLIDTVKGRIAILPDRSDDTKYVLFRAHPTNNVSINEEVINNKTIRCWRLGANESWNFLITDRGIKPYVYLYNTNASNTWTLGFTLNNLQRIGRKVYDGEKLVGTLPDASIVDSLGEIRAATETINGTSATVSWDHVGLTFPVVVDPALVIQPSSADNGIRSAIPTTNLGTQVNTAIGYNSVGPSMYRTLVRFDYPSLPVDAVLSSALLKLWHIGAGTSGDHAATPQTYVIYRLTQTAWTELGSTYNTYDGTNNWATAGGDFTTSGGSTFILGDNNTGVFRTIDILSLARYGQVNGNSIDFIMKNNTEGPSTYYFQVSTKDEPTASLRPQLTLNYELLGSLYKHHTSVALIGRIRL